VLQLRNRIAGTVLALVGLIFLVVGGYLVVSAGWGTATATATSCGGSYVGTGTGRHRQTICQVTWDDGGRTHDGSVIFSGRSAHYPGESFEVHVDGDQVALPSPLWARIGTLAVGAVALAGGLVLALRRPRRGLP
jgi:hypothetical protein